MSPEAFCYWLHGLFEIGDAKTLDAKQVKIIKDHLDLVFSKVTPDRTSLQAALDATPIVDLLKSPSKSRRPGTARLCRLQPATYC